MAAQRVRADFEALDEIARCFDREAEKTRRTLDELHGVLDILLDGDWADAGPWSPDGQKIATTLHTYGLSTPPEFYTVDFAERQIIDSCYEGDAFGVWSPDGRYFATSPILNGSDRVLLVIDVVKGEIEQVATDVSAIYAWLP